MAEFKACDPVAVPACVLAELSDLRAELRRMTSLHEQFRADNRRLQVENQQLRADNQQLRADNTRLRGELDELRRQAKRQAAPFSKGPPRPHPKRPGRKAGKAHGRHGHRAAPDHVDEFLDAPLPDACPDCGGPLEPTDTATQFQTELPRRPLVRQFTIQRGHCRQCGKHVQGRHPLQTSDAVGACAAQVGPDAQAAVVVLNKTLGLSHAKVAATFDQLLGIPLTRGASAQIVLRAARRLEPADQEICQETKAAGYLTPDETGWRVGGQPAWLHVWVSPRAVCYGVEADRSADALEELLGGAWAGKMVHDGFSSYGRFERATHQQCLGHLLRRVRELAARASRGAVHYPRKLVALFTEAIHLRNRHLRGEVTAAELRAARTGFDRRLEELAWPAREVPAYETLSNHLWNHLGEWFAFLDDPVVEPTNWEAEQALRPAVVNRKVWGGNRTWAGAHAQEVLTSVLQTCARVGHAGLEFVSQTLRAFGNPLLPHPILLPER